MFDISTYNWPAYQGRVPYQHQKITTGFILSNPNSFILNEQGTGKTLSVLWALDILFKAKRIRKVLVISPLSTIRSVWLNEAMMNMPHRRVGLAHGNAQLRLNVLHDPLIEIVVINHDGIKIIEEAIAREKPSLIIIDEITAYKSNSERTKCMLRITDNGRKMGWLKGVWSLSGDLAPERPTDAFYPARITVPQNQFLPRYFGQFKAATMNVLNEYVATPKPEAPQVVAMCTQPAIRFTRDQCLDLPDTTYQVIEVPLTVEQQKYYDAMRRDAYIECDTGEIKAVNAAVKLNKLLQISAGAVKTVDGSVIELDCKDRQEALLEIFEESPQKKLVVFVTFRASIVQLLRFLESKKVRVAAIHGDVNHDLRSKHIDQFQTGNLEVLILQPQSAAHGITLTAASTLVWYSLVPSNELFGQGNARIIRAGQTRKTLIYMFASTKAEKHIAAILRRKGNMSEEILRLFVDHSL